MRLFLVFFIIIIIIITVILTICDFFLDFFIHVRDFSKFVKKIVRNILFTWKILRFILGIFFLNGVRFSDTFWFRLSRKNYLHIPKLSPARRARYYICTLSVRINVMLSVATIMNSIQSNNYG